MPGSVLVGLVCRNTLRALAVAYFDGFALNHNEADVDALTLAASCSWLPNSVVASIRRTGCRPLSRSYVTLIDAALRPRLDEGRWVHGQEGAVSSGLLCLPFGGESFLNLARPAGAAAGRALKRLGDDVLRDLGSPALSTVATDPLPSGSAAPVVFSSLGSFSNLGFLVRLSTFLMSNSSVPSVDAGDSNLIVATL